MWPLYTRTENSINVFTLHGVCDGEIYRKICPTCKTTYFYNYCEKQKIDSHSPPIRNYYDINFSQEPYFSVTNQSFFEKKLLDTVCEEIVTCNVQFTNWATCYNRLNRNKNLMDYRALIQAWLIYQIWRRLGVSFPVVRDKSRNIDIEEICAILYPELRRTVDSKWINHNCQYCCTKLVVLDGDAKAYRTVCSFQPKKVIKSGHLNEFIECAHSPMP